MDHKKEIIDITSLNKKELIAVTVSLLIMWAGYYADNNLFSGNVLFSLIVSLILIIIGLCTVFPLIWVNRITGEGISGLGIKKKRLAVSLGLSSLLAIWRFIEIREYLGSKALMTTILFNAFSIWEVLFIFGWLFTRYKRAFGKIPAIILTAVSVGIYHIGTLSPSRIAFLCLTVAICGIFYALTENIFTLWPIYWTIGCSASTLGSGMEFTMEMVYLSAITMIVQTMIIICFYRSSKKVTENNRYNIAA